MTSSSRKKVEEIDKDHNICSVCKLKSNRKDLDNLSVDFYLSKGVREGVVTNN